MNKAIFIYDEVGKIWHWSLGENPITPNGLPYIIIENYNPIKPIEKIDVSQNPPVPVYVKTKEEIEFEEISLEDYKEKRQIENKQLLATFLKNNPILWSDNLYYGVTLEDQNEMSLDLSTYQIKKNLGDTNWKLQWHSIKSDCRDFTEEEFLGLLNAIIEFVYPYRQLEMKYKEAIYTAETKDEVKNINIIYELGVTTFNE